MGKLCAITPDLMSLRILIGSSNLDATTELIRDSIFMDSCRVVLFACYRLKLKVKQAFRSGFVLSVFAFESLLQRSNAL